ncbi:hypothetical protein EV360DRAFT_72297 [Lentinula raphanica]|nr:hypothetical protein EV360DRAFT_72297 [Lentinula raphanica]
MSVPTEPVASFERSYVHAELSGLNKAELIKLVERQITKWPSQQPFHRSQVRVKELKAALLDPSNGFTTNLLNLMDKSDSLNISQSVQTMNSPSSLASQTPVNSGGSGHRSPKRSSDYKHPRSSNYHHTEATCRRFRCSQMITVPCSDCAGHGSNEYTIKFSDIYSSLQQTNTALEGTGELTTSDPDERGYGHVLMKGNFCATVPSTESLLIPASKYLSLAPSTNLPSFISHNPKAIIPSVDGSSVNNVSFQYIQNASGSASGSDTVISRASHQSLRELFNDPNSIPLQFADKFYGPKKGLKTTMVTELTNEALKLPGYTTFISNHHCVLPYHEVAAHWAFITTFLEVHFCHKCPITHNVKSKKAIAKALGIWTTSLSAAEQGHELVQRYGPGGSHSAPEVIAELSSEKVGAVGLMDFLHQWAAAHPVDIGSSS